MAKSQTNIMVRIRRPEGWRFCRIVTGGGGKIKPEWAIVDGKEERHPEAKYFIDFLQDGKRIRKPAVSAAEAVTMAAQQGQELIARKQAARAGIVLPEPESTNGGRSLREAADGYLLEIEAHKSKKTHSAYSTALTYFLESCRKKTLEEITRTDLLAFKTYLKDKKKQSDRSCWNKFSNVMGFLKWAKITGLGISANDWPIYTEREPEDYGRDLLARFFAACDEMELVWFKYFRFTACREGEVMHVSWPDIDLERKVVTVRENPRFNWRPKKNKEREIPIPTELADLLVSWKKKSDAKCELVFPTTGCKPKQNFLDECKAVAKRAKLPTGRRGFHLHKFRAHRTTELARALSTEEAMRITGHTDYESFKRYLAKEKINVLQLQIEAMDAVGASA